MFLRFLYFPRWRFFTLQQPGSVLFFFFFFPHKHDVKKGASNEHRTVTWLLRLDMELLERDL